MVFYKPFDKCFGVRKCFLSINVWLKLLINWGHQNSVIKKEEKNCMATPICLDLKLFAMSLRTCKYQLQLAASAIFVNIRFFQIGKYQLLLRQHFNIGPTCTIAHPGCYFKSTGWWWRWFWWGGGFKIMEEARNRHDKFEFAASIISKVLKICTVCENALWLYLSLSMICGIIGTTCTIRLLCQRPLMMMIMVMMMMMRIWN